eukprot:3498218-Amphidinium_carterae.1
MEMDDNAFTGTLPNIGIRAMQAVTEFHVGSNCFTGTFPSGIISLSNAEIFAIENNCFTGMLPRRPLLPQVLEFYIAYNGFAGSVPAVFRHLSMGYVIMLDLGHNYFEGAIPTWFDARAVLVNHNLLAGSIPQRLLDGWDRKQKWFVASTLAKLAQSKFS